MFQFVLILLRNPFFLIGTGIFVGFAVYYNHLLKAYAHVERSLEELEEVLTRRRQLAANVVNPAGTGNLAHHLQQLELPEQTPLLTDDLPARFEEEYALGIELESLINSIHTDQEMAADTGFQSWCKQINETNVAIGIAKHTYNMEARSFNLKIESFPAGLIAYLLKIPSQPLFM